MSSTRTETSSISREPSCLPSSFIAEVKNMITISEGGGKLTWNNHSDQTPTFHTPLAQLYFLFRGRDNLLHPTTVETVGEITNKYSLGFTDSLPQISTSAGPHELFSLLNLLSPYQSKSANIEEIVNGKVTKARRAFLAGCISVTSAINLIQQLRLLGFKGELDIVDLSPIPLQLIDAYMKAAHIEETYGTHVSTRVADLRLLHTLLPLSEDTDIVIADIVGLYLTDGETLDVAANLQHHVLASGGVLLVRELCQFESVAGVSRLVSQNAGEEQEQEFREWLHQVWDIDVSSESVTHMRETLFSGGLKKRLSYNTLLPWIKSAPNSGCALLLNGFYSVPNVPQRVFSVGVFQKEGSNAEASLAA